MRRQGRIHAFKILYQLDILRLLEPYKAGELPINRATQDLLYTYFLTYLKSGAAELAGDALSIATAVTEGTENTQATYPSLATAQVEVEEALQLKSVQEFTEKLVLGVLSHLKLIDQALDKASHHWRLERMSKIDINIMRLAVYEMFYCDDIPRAVSINEAIEIAKIFGDQGSSAFINGVLDQLNASELAVLTAC